MASGPEALFVFNSDNCFATPLMVIDGLSMAGILSYPISGMFSRISEVGPNWKLVPSTPRLSFWTVWFRHNQEETDCTLMLWSVDSCQNKVSADQCHLIVLRTQVSTHRGRVRFWSYPLISYWFSSDRRLKFILFKSIWNILCLCHDGPELLKFWFQTNHGCENSASYLIIQAGKTFSYPGHALVKLYVQFLCSDWSKFDRWLHAKNLCIILKLVYFDS